MLLHENAMLIWQTLWKLKENITCNIQEVANKHLIFNKAANKLIQQFIWSHSVDKLPAKKAPVSKQHCSEEKMPAKWKIKNQTTLVPTSNSPFTNEEKLQKVNRCYSNQWNCKNNKKRPKIYQFNSLNPGSCLSSLALLSRLKSSLAIKIWMTTINAHI